MTDLEEALKSEITQLRQINQEQQAELGTVRVERNAAICEANDLARERIPTVKVKEMLIGLFSEMEWRGTASEFADNELKKHGWEVEDG